MKSMNLALTAVLFLAACSEDRSPTQSKTTTTTPVPTGITNWTINLTVVSVTATGSCPGGTLGATVEDLHSQITREGDSLSIFTNVDDPIDWPTFIGTVNGDRFTTTARWFGGKGCNISISDELAGSFSADGRSFDATETALNGSSGNEVTVQTHWTGTKT